MKITSLVTGGAGFIGSHVAYHLLRQGHDVVILDDLSGGAEENIPEGAIFYKGSILDTELIDKLFDTHQFTYVYHLAAYAAEGLSHFIRHFNYKNNLIGSVNLINAAVNYKVKCFVFTSSIAVYGTNTLPLIETQHPKPEDPYGIAKYAVEMDIINAHQMFGLNYVIFRPHNVYGVHQNIGDKYRNVVGIFMNQVLKSEPLTIFGDGLQTRAFSYIDDVAPYIANAAWTPKAYNTTFNIGNDDSFSVLELVEKVKEAMQSKTSIKYLEQREEVVHAYADHQLFDSVFTPKSKVSLSDGLREMATWVKKHGSRSSSKFEAIEILQKLPNSWK